MSFPPLFRRWRESEDGSSTVEFVILFPAVMFVFMVAFEAGLYMVRNAMLERGVDIAIRDVRLGGTVPNIKELKAKICDEALVLPDCENSIQVEMDSIAIAPGAINARSGAVGCVDKSSDLDPATQTTYSIGVENEMMLVRVCALSQPMFPTTGLGVKMAVNDNGDYAIVSTAAFVNEPGQRLVSDAGTNTGGGGSNGGIGTGVGQ